MPPDNIYRLKNFGLPALSSIDDFAHAMKLSPSTLRSLSISSDSLYKTYYLPKKSGGKREIAQPCRELKAVQSWILRNILDKLNSSPYSKGFEIGTSILDNATPHVGASYILSIDLEDFFPSIPAYKVYGVFSSIGYNKEMSRLLMNLCTYYEVLPQGSPASPKLANLVCARLDARIQGYAGPRGITYTRYADDITLSANTAIKMQKAKSFLGTIIAGEDLVINKRKTKICGTKRQKKVTGLVLSENRVGIGRQKLREIRSAIYNLFTGKSVDYLFVNGWLSFVYSVDKKSYNRLYSYIDEYEKKFPSSVAKDNLIGKRD
ncbi:retron St85 family RNA-directed DNA polymerase [Vibrio splendidus]|uniref:retron St85 family RNA-directed DNA polymerase n=1 Tax=Vibrio splendidus TaxID=29497 RepID=UPI00246921D6|nr:retron St85 family RNA-directed DNA polymerase [Vibrio splendidus]MDH5938978.1 retron St85 family RNA-directed DNA polymerase [Vibrio splendidus]